MKQLPFSLFSAPMEKHVDALFKNATTVLKVNISKQDIKDAYLDAYPEDVNVMFRKRKHYDGVYDLHFVRTLGTCIFIMKDNTYTTVWDMVTGNYFQDVADTMHKFVLNRFNKDVEFFHYPNSSVGHKPNIDAQAPGIEWTHFYANIPTKFKSTTQSTLSNSVTPVTKGLENYTPEIIETVLDLIQSNNIYRGQEFKTPLSNFLVYLKEYHKLETEQEKLVYIYNALSLNKPNISLRSTVIGTLLDDLAEGKDLEDAVKSFEHKVAPHNYQRPSAIITPRMITMAQQKIQELGFEKSLDRRFATETDLNISNVLFTHRTALSLNVFDDLKEESISTFKEKDIKNVPTLSLEDFINTIIPKASVIETLVESKHSNNFVSLITAKDKTSPSLFKWENNFSWSYNGNVTDSLREQVKKFGGSVEGDVRFSLAWFNSDDLDLHLKEPGRLGRHLYYSNRGAKSSYGGVLDLDMNGLDSHSDSEPVENIIYEDISKMPDGVYKLEVNRYSTRTTKNKGFIVELEVLGKICRFSSDSSETSTITFEKKGEEFSVQNQSSNLVISSSSLSKEIWGINTNSWTKVNNICLSPNFWDGKQIGNKHLFMFIDNCINPEDTNGFYNEFLCNELKENRKVLNVLGSKLKAKTTDDQLSGLGFSSTIKNDFYVRVTNQNNSKKVFKVIVDGIDL